MKIACASDIHGSLSLEWPRADVLVMAGDILPDFVRIKQANAAVQFDWVRDNLATFLRAVTTNEIYNNVIFVPGNHDMAFELHRQACQEVLEEIDGVHLLLDSGIALGGKLFWGSPWTPHFFGQYFSFNFPDPRENKSRARAHARNCWEQIPTETDVVITHGPPFNVLDMTERGDEVGCPHLLDEIVGRVKPQLHIFGHIHPSYGQCERYGTRFVNAAICNRVNKPTKNVQVVEL